MEPESLRLEENHRELEDMDLTIRPRGFTHVLPLEEIANLAAEGGQPAETLMNVVALIARRFETDVCSAYLLEPDRANLVLAAIAEAFFGICAAARAATLVALAAGNAFAAEIVIFGHSSFFLC